MTAPWPWEVPPPVLFNPWKHHAGALRQRIADVGRGGPAALAALPSEVLVIGTELMDLYTGALAPARIGAGVLARLRDDGLLAWDTYRPWVEAGGGYRLLTLPEDSSVWVLRAGDPASRYVHLHPGRWTPATRRVRANVLKTTVLVLAHVAVHGGDPFDVALVNHVRARHLGLSPVKGLAADQGLRTVIDLLRPPPAPPAALAPDHSPPAAPG
jgi:hypothetical protein